MTGYTLVKDLWQREAMCRDDALVGPANSLEVAAKALERAARVVTNAQGTKPRHTTARDGGCRDDCIPCGIEALKEALSWEA